MKSYPPIADHGLIGDLQTAALVTTDGSIDWYCCPRFDSPSVFASLLDRSRGGYFQIAPEGHDYVTKQLYFPDSAVLITRFMAPGGVGEVIDFMPIDRPEEATERHQLIRGVRVVRGKMRFSMVCAPRFNFGRTAHDVEMAEHGAVFHTPDLSLTLHSSVGLERRENDVQAHFTLHAGQRAAAVLESAAEGLPRAIDPGEVFDTFTQTVEFWRKWLDRSTYRGRWREIVQRSAITL
ncbi:MAG TPA: trehalase-like domain-containing protein, partial [Ktedonobacterales bacterium]|nr:trehalase-like domain-containing protein [Ktedonobacterales bacterium]